MNYKGKKEKRHNKERRFVKEHAKWEWDEFDPKRKGKKERLKKKESAKKEEMWWKLRKKK